MTQPGDKILYIIIAIELLKFQDVFRALPPPPPSGLSPRVSQQSLNPMVLGTSPLFRSKQQEGGRSPTDMEQKMKFIHIDFNYFREARALVTCVFLVITVNQKENE